MKVLNIILTCINKKQNRLAIKRREISDDDESWLHPSTQRFAFILSVPELWRKINFHARDASSAKGNFRNIFISILITFITQLYEFISWCSRSAGEAGRGDTLAGLNLMECRFVVLFISPSFLAIVWYALWFNQWWADESRERLVAFAEREKFWWKKTCFLFVFHCHSVGFIIIIRS